VDPACQGGLAVEHGTSATTPTARDVVQSLERGLAVMLAFADQPTRLTATQIAERTGLSRPAVRRLLITLRKLGYVHSDGRTFGLTAQVLRLGYAYLSSQSLIKVAEPHLERLVGQTKESCSLATLDGTEVVLISRVLTRRILAINLEVGSRLPAYPTSMGRVLLAALSEQQLDDYLARVELRPLTRHTITDPDELHAELARVRQQGWCIVDQDLEEDVCSAAAPVRDANGRVIAALAASVHAGRVDFDTMRGEFLTCVLDAARAISADLGDLSPAVIARR
jgi:IclR family pca regulon transcriptional regulator